MRSSMILGWLLAASGAAFAQAQFMSPWETGVELAQGKKHSERADMRTSVMLYGRASAIGGEIDPDIPLDYGDLFGGGTGFALEGSLLWRAADVYLGAFASVGRDTYDGQEDTDDFGDTLEAEDMTITTTLVGFRVLFPFGRGFHWDGHIGMGVAHYDAVDGVLTLSGVPSDVQIFKATSVFAMDFGTRFGYSIGLFTADLGFGFRFQGAPDNGDLNFSSSGPAIAYFEIGVGLGF